MYLDEKNLPQIRTETEIQHDNLVNFIAALRSGKFKQTFFTLYEDGEYCAMGVAYRSLGLTKRQAEPSFSEWGVLKPRVVKQLGLDEKIVDKIVHMNDESNRSFKYIASYLERYHLPKLQKKLGM